MYRLAVLFVVFLLGSLGLSGLARAEYPERPITLIVPFGAGGGTDVMARTFVPFVTKYLGGDASIVIVNKPGASGLIGYTEVANSKPDGYVIGTFNTPGGNTLYIQGTARYTLDSLDPIAGLIYDPLLLNVISSSKLNSLEDMLTFAKDNPGVLTVGFGGIGATGHLSMLFLQQLPGLADLKFTYVPFAGGAKARAALLGGHVSVGAQTLSEMAGYAAEGEIRILGIQSENRSPLAPDAPTFRELGHDLVYGASRGFVAPAGVPKEILAKLADAIGKAAKDPEFLAAATKQFLPVQYMDNGAYNKHLQDLDAKLKALWQENPWR